MAASVALCLIGRPDDYYMGTGTTTATYYKYISYIYSFYIFFFSASKIVAAVLWAVWATAKWLSKLVGPLKADPQASLSTIAFLRAFF